MGQFVWSNSIAPLPPTTKVVLVGYSMGGFVADSMMHDPRAKTKLAGVVFISTASTHSKHVLYDTIHTHVANTMKHAVDNEPHTADEVFTEEELGRMSPADRDVLDKALYKPKDLLTQKTEWKMQAMAIFLWYALEPSATRPVLAGLPVLIVHGERDLLVSVESAHLLHTFFGAASTLVTLPDAGHSLLREFQGPISKAIATWARGT